MSKAKTTQKPEDKTFTLKDFFEMANRLHLKAFNSSKKRTPDLSVSVPNKGEFFVNMNKNEQGAWVWVLGPQKIRRATEAQELGSAAI
jgi:hypothetical protein